jgi:hypothetical protein
VQGSYSEGVTLCSSYTSPAYFAAVLMKSIPGISVECTIGEYKDVPINPQYQFTVSAPDDKSGAITVSIWSREPGAKPNSVTLFPTQTLKIPNTNFSVRTQYNPQTPTKVKVEFV